MIPVRVCGCSFCQMHGGAYTSDPEAALAVDIDDRSLLQRYRFGTRTADFCICRRCGVLPFVTSEIHGNTYAVVNVNCFVGVGREALDRTPSDFDGEGVDDRLQRRASRWIPRVRINCS